MLFKKLKKPDPKAEQKLRDDIEKNGGLEKGDVAAMLLSAFLTIMPLALAILGLFCLIAWIFIS